MCDVSEEKASCNDIPYALCSKDDTGTLMCQCVESYTSDTNSLHCMAPDFTSRCIENEQCTDFHPEAKCSADTESCVCPDGFVQFKKECVEGTLFKIYTSRQTKELKNGLFF